jgi:NTP pyrophosphatase (non-canonical NTP hydrolase)
MERYDFLTVKESFIHYFNSVSDDCYYIAKRHGFWDKYSPENERVKLIRNVEKIALIHSEVSKALEALRCENPESKHINGFTCVEEELADTVIRIMDLAKANNWKVSEAIIEKMKFNDNRPYLHEKLF